MPSLDKGLTGAIRWQKQIEFQYEIQKQRRELLHPHSLSIVKIYHLFIDSHVFTGIGNLATRERMTI